MMCLWDWALSTINHFKILSCIVRSAPLSNCLSFCLSADLLAVYSEVSAAALTSERRKTTHLLGDTMFSVLVELLHMYQVVEVRPLWMLANWAYRGTKLFSHIFGFNIKQLTENTFNYLSSLFTAVNTSDPYHSCRSHSTHTHTHTHSHTQPYPSIHTDI